jgi:four helix bundle protein
MGNGIKTKQPKNVRTHKDLDVWNKSMELAEKIYLLLRQFPKEEQYGIVSQMKRSAISVPSNIAEGAARNSNKEFLQYLYIALGSLAEIETQLLLANRLKFIQEATLLDNIESIRKMLLGLIKFLKGKEKEHERV